MTQRGPAPDCLCHVVGTSFFVVYLATLSVAQVYRPIASNDGMISLLQRIITWKGREKKRSWPDLRYHPGTCLGKDLGKPQETSVRTTTGLRAEI
jgi:hypothetical protein